MFFSGLVATASATGLVKSTDTIQLHSAQLLITITDRWTNLRGKLYCFQKHHEKWVLQFSNRVVVGSKGLGLGQGIVPVTIERAPVKREGDLKAPAGIFKIGSAFGYADRKDAQWISNAYVKATDTLICVDDQHSASYNKLVNNDHAKSDWNSFEPMHRNDNLYKWGLFINHNANKITPGYGSCIFMHIWRNSHTGTEGCTAMKEKHILRVLHWIRSDENPLLVQLPKAEYERLRTLYGWPKIR